MGKNRFVIGTIIGAAAGVVAGVLTAPKSGEETRDELKIKARELREEAARRAQEARESKKPIDSMKQQVEHIAKRSKESLKDISKKR